MEHRRLVRRIRARNDAKAEHALVERDGGLEVRDGKVHRVALVSERLREGALRRAHEVPVECTMQTSDASPVLSLLFSELVDGASAGHPAFILNTGDAGLLRSLDKLSAADASRSANGGATIAAHSQHLRYGLSLMNRWAAEGGNPFADATWDAAWKLSSVNDTEWEEIRRGLREEARRWLEVLRAPRTVTGVEFTGLVGSIA